ncbi:MAG: T9SS type A sorting domain-containing protein [Chlorobi bacterium]|nr:T9SS type A sorting domain-containing protein [Chlorobiota bacterium]
MFTRIVLISILFILTLSAESPAKIFYVDAANGNDASDGLSVDSPWKTVSKLNDNIAQLSPGDSVLFKRGGVWTGERIYVEEISGTSFAPILFGAYGEGDAPIITAIEEFQHTWENDFGNLWKAADPPEENPGRLWFNGAEILRANKRSELGETFRWFYDEANGDFFLYSIDDPSNAVFQYSVDFPMIVADAEYIKIENLDLQGGWTAVYVLGSRNIIFENMKIGAFAQNGISTDAVGFPAVQNLRILNSRFDSFFTLDYSSADYYRGTGDRGCSDGVQIHSLAEGKISGCYFKNWGHASINLDGSRLAVANNKIFNNYLTSPDIAYGGRIVVDGESFGNEIYNNQIINASVQSQLNGQSNRYHHNIFYGTKSPPFNPPDFIEAGISVQAYDNIDVKGNTYENNLMINCDGPGIEISGNNEHNIYDNVFRNNVVYNCGIKQNNIGIEIEKNEYGETYGNYFRSNLIYSSSSETVISFRGNAMNVEQFNSVSGADSYFIDNNIDGNPLFVSVSELDFHLQSGSPCIDAGIKTFAQFDFEGNPIPYGTAPDIGIYEYSKPNGAGGETSQLEEFKLFQNYPNPFSKSRGGNTTTTIGYRLTEAGNVTLKVFNALGQVVSTLVNSYQEAGTYKAIFPPSGKTNNLPSGIYFYSIQTDVSFAVKKMILLK